MAARRIGRSRGGRLRLWGYAAVLATLPARGLCATRSVRVLDQDGQPLPGAIVACLTISSAGIIAGAGTPLSSTDARGHAEVPASGCRPTASLQGYRPTLLEQVQTQPESSGPVLVLRKSTVSLGAVLLELPDAERGRIYVGYLQALSLRSVALGIVVATGTDSELLIPNVPPASSGTYLFGAYGPGDGMPEQDLLEAPVVSGAATRAVVRPAKKRNWADLRLKAPPVGSLAVVGRVLDTDGRPVPGFTILLKRSPAPDAPACSWGFSGPQGAYTIRLPPSVDCSTGPLNFPAELFVQDLPPTGFEAIPTPGPVPIPSADAAVKIDFSTAGYFPAARIRVAVAQLSTAAIASVRGFVTDPTGTSLSGLRVDARLSDDPMAPVCQRVTTSADGGFVLSLPEGFRCDARKWAYPVRLYLAAVPPGRDVILAKRSVELSTSTVPVAADLVVNAFDSAAYVPEDASPVFPVPLSRLLSVTGAPPSHAISTPTLRGSVSDVADTPVALARISWRLKPDPRALVCGNMVTDSSGLYRASIPAGTYCGTPLRFPTTVYLSLEAPPGYSAAPGFTPAYLTGTRASLKLDWGESGPQPALLAVPGHGHLCVTFSIDGRPLPSGLATLAADYRAWAGDDPFGGNQAAPGSSERSLTRLRDGRVCWQGLDQGNYTVAVSPFSMGQPLAAAFIEASGGLTPRFRLSIGGDGEAHVYDVAGRLLASGDVPLQYRAPDQRPATLNGTLRFLGDSQPDLRKNPLLLAVLVADTPVCGWVQGRLKGGAIGFSMDVPEGYLTNIMVPSKFAVIAADPPISRRGVTLSRSLPVSVSLDLVSAVTVSGVVRAPDGSPFVPYQGSREASRSAVEVWGREFIAGHAQTVYADEDGVYEFPMDPDGRYALWAHGAGPAFQWPSPPAGWSSAHAPQGLDFRFGDWAQLEISGLAPSASGPVRDATPHLKQRWLFGITAGTTSGPDAASRFLGDVAVPIRLMQSDGVWKDMEAKNVSWLRPENRIFPAGDYDFYWLELQQDTGLERELRPPVGISHTWAQPSLYTVPFLKVLGVARAFPLKAHEICALSMPAPQTPDGTAALEGVLRGSLAPTRQDIFAAASESAIHDLVSPRLHLFLDTRYVGTAFGLMDPKLVAPVLEAALNGDARSLDALLKGATWRIHLEGWPAGKYTARLDAFGHQPRELPLELRDGQTTSLNLDLDAPNAP